MKTLNPPELITLADAARRLLLPARKASRAVEGGLMRPVAMVNGAPLFDPAAVEALRADMAIACLRRRDPRGRKPRGFAEVVEVANNQQPGTGET